MTNALQTGDRIVILKGCKDRGIDKGTTAQVTTVEELGADYGYNVLVAFKLLNGFKAGESRRFYARHINRLSDATINLNDGNPSHKIVIRKKV